MARSRTGLAGTMDPVKLPDLQSPDTAFSGGIGLGSVSPETSTVRKAAQIRTAAPAPQPTGLNQQLMGAPSPTTIASPGTAPTGTPPPTPTPSPTPTTTPTPTPSPLPGQGTPYDPTRLNYEGSTYTGPPVQSTGPTINKPTGDQLAAIQTFMDAKGITITKDWRAKLAADPQGYLQQLRATKAATPEQQNNLRRVADFMEKTLAGQSTATNPDNAALYYDQASYNQGLTRLRESGLQGSDEEDQQVLQMLASRGLLNSGIAAQELTRLRGERAQNYRTAAQRLNEILFSNASEQAKQEAMARLQSDLSTTSQERLLRLKYQLEQDLAKTQHQNDFLGFLATGAGAVAGAALPSAPRPGGNLYGGQGQQNGGVQTILSSDEFS